jgi:hypothetical protein
MRKNIVNLAVKSMISLDDSARLIEKILDVMLEKHDSSFFGGDYYGSADDSQPNVTLFLNYNAMLDEFDLEQYPDYNFVLGLTYCEGTLDLASLIQALADAGVEAVVAERWGMG